MKLRAKIKFVVLTIPHYLSQYTNYRTAGVIIIITHKILSFLISEISRMYKYVYVAKYGCYI